MKKLLKRVRVALTLLIALLLLLILASWSNHKVQLAREDELFNRPIGRSVEVNGHLINVYDEGEGDRTLVFMSGGGTSSPVLDFQSLYSSLSDTYRIAVVEKAGYGFSEIADVDRDIDTILSETRQALVLAGIEGPYVLSPHSMSGIEALYWAQTYPEEVTAIIGLDMAVPQAYENYPINMPLMRLGAVAANIGITRWIPGVAESDAIRYGALSEDRKKLYRAVFYRRTATPTMLAELKEIKANARKVAKGGVPDVPILMFASNGQGTGWDGADWRRFQRDYVQSLANGALIELDCSHYVHSIEYEKIAAEIKIYMDHFR